MLNYDVLIIGGGAAGFFTAINAAVFNSKLRIAIIERGNEVLGKVKISGGGRCNLTHAIFTPSQLIENYPRGGKELRGPFHRFCTGDTMQWFEENKVPLKIEEDGRVFPISDTSQTIIDCFLRLTEKSGIKVLKNHPVKDFYKEKDQWQIHTSKGSFTSKKLIITTGSNPKIWNLLSQLGHTIIPPVPSLFTFVCKDKIFNNLAGISVKATIQVANTTLTSHGDLLITHQGISGPAVLKLSAWGARYFYDVNYRFSIRINWLPDTNKETILSELKKYRVQFSKQQITTYSRFGLPKRLWINLLKQTGIEETCKWADISNKTLAKFTKNLVAFTMEITGKNTFKEEFVTAGGVDLKEINFKKFESKIHPGLFFSGEVLNIDAVTGGFNFQNAWTGGYCIAETLGRNS